MGGSLSSPFLLRKSFSNHFSHANEKLCFTLHSALGNPACSSADRAKLFHREQTERHQERGDQKMTMTCQHTKTNRRVSQQHHYERWTRSVFIKLVSRKRRYNHSAANITTVAPRLE
jgi:hypothetical protein